MLKVDLNTIRELAEASRQAVWQKAEACGREPKIYLHWSAGHYGQFFDDYHINIDADGSYYISTSDFAETLAHTWKRNTGAIGISLACCVGANTETLGSEPPTAAQIEAMAKAIDAVATAWWLTIDTKHVLTHGEAADNLDGERYHDRYGCYNGCERWDLQYLGTDESPCFVWDYKDARTGGNVLRGKANWYRNQRKG